MQEKNKMSFFKRLKIAIFKLDEYGVFIEEKLSVAIKYVLLIILFVSIVLAFITTYEFSKEIRKGISYIENEFPDFSFENSKLKVNEYVEAHDQEYDFKLIVDTTENISEEKINEYNDKSKQSSTSLIVLNDKIIYRLYDAQTEYLFKDLNTAIDINNTTKQEILEQYYSMGGTSSICTIYMIIATISLLIGNIIEIATDCILVAFIGIIVARICGIVIRSSVAGTLAIYSLTLPIICSFIYSIVYNFTGFEIKYFQAMYLMIAYVYIIAAIFIIKTDLIKQAKDLMRIKSVEEQIKDEMEQEKLKEQEEKDKQEKDKQEKEPENNDNKKDEPKPKTELKEPDKEPDGSEI